MLKYLLLLSVLCTPLFSQVDTSKPGEEQFIRILDSMNLTIKEVFISGNEVTKEEVIQRELSLKKGSKLTYKKLQNDYLNLSRLNLFTKVDIEPLPLGTDEVIIHVNVQEKFYFLPLPKAGMEEGEWKKVWIGANIRWNNFRGMNEKLSFNFRIFYNPAVSASYHIPWIGKNLHLFTTFSTTWSRTRNKSLNAVGKQSGSTTLSYEDPNFENYKFQTALTIGKYIYNDLNLYSKLAYDYLKVSEYAEGRTLSPTGIDKYLTASIGVNYDTKNQSEFATEGFYLNSEFVRYGLLDKAIDFGRFKTNIETYIPVKVNSNYSFSLASNIKTSFAIGALIPFYDHEYLGYSDDYVRGWKNVAFEGEHGIKLFNELRIPIIKPRYLTGKSLPLLKDIDLINKLYLKYGLYFTIFYDMGTVWDKGTTINKLHFIKGTGIGLNFILPFDYIVRIELATRLKKPIVGQLGFSLSAKF